jgi:hypothetical protein
MKHIIILTLIIPLGIFAQDNISGTNKRLSDLRRQSTECLSRFNLDPWLQTYGIDLLSFNLSFNGFNSYSEKNVLLIPEIGDIVDSLNYPTSGLQLDTIKSLNRLIFFNNDNYLGTLIFPNHTPGFYCPLNPNAYTKFECAKYTYHEPFYIESLRLLLKQNPNLVFKDSKIERVWFYIGRNGRFYVCTYDCEILTVDTFFKLKDVKNYQLQPPVLNPVSD